MKKLLFIISLIYLSACNVNQVDTMVLLNEKVTKVEVSRSNGIGDVNLDILTTYEDKPTIRIFENAIKSAVQKEVTIPKSTPDYDLIIDYGDNFPRHAIHLWLGNDKEQSIMMYMVEGGDTYVTSMKITKALRDLLLNAE
ncbi:MULTISPECIES: hypothetical protein [Bacillus]|uniref:hypothetical protein n=1 Tax=Bacillus TaxID=1386 RepID=UPI000BB9515C|nr:MULTISPECIES: hypothetical protein [Bacillus]